MFPPGLLGQIVFVAANRREGWDLLQGKEGQFEPSRKGQGGAKKARRGPHRAKKMEGD